MDRADRTISQQLTWSRSVQPPEPASIEWTLEFIDRSGDIFGNFTKRRRWHEGPRETYTWSSERKPTQSSTGSINCRLATGSWSYRYLTAAVFLLTTMAFFLSSSRGRRLFLRRSVRSFNADAGGATDGRVSVSSLEKRMSAELTPLSQPAASVCVLLCCH